ncbi:MAG TPA: serine protease, partial [Paenibacillus sp.]|nr:serine protease [Paenibacillus sp.]
MEMLLAWLKAFGGLVTSPFYYLALLFIALHVRKQTSIERKLFSVKLHTWWSEWGQTVLWGALVGVGVSIGFLFLGASIAGSTLLMLWIVALLLAVVRVRYMCFAYAAGVLGLAQVGAGLLDPASLPGGAAIVVRELQAMHLPSVLALVGVLHLAEAALVYKMAGRLATPLFFEGKRGKTVGGYQLQGFWPVP